MLVVLLVAGVGAGCTSRRNVSLERDSYVGEYTYHADDEGSPHGLDRLTLKEDDTYILVKMPNGHQGPKEQGRWQLIDKPVPSIAFGDTVYPIEVKKGNIRLLINEDLGWSYEKTK